MLIESLALVAAVTAVDPFNHPGYGLPSGGVRHLATCPPYPDRRADSVLRPGFNGRLFLTTPIMGGVDMVPSGCDQPGAEYYGAVDGGQTVYLRVGELTVGINPWHQWNDESFPRFEAARQEWLKERGYIGGVRTFVNDANFTYSAVPTRVVTADDAPAARPAGEIKPRAIIELPPDMPRFRSRMQVDAGAALERAGVTRQLTKVVRPQQVAAKQ